MTAPGGRRRRGGPESPEERLELVESALEELRVAVNEDGIPVLVEGDKDEAALRNLGITGPIVKVHTGQQLFTFVETFSESYRAAVLLVDWDTTGGRLARRLKDACAANDVALDDAHRLAFMRATRGEVRTVESLDTYVRNLEEAHGGPGPVTDVEGIRRAAREEARRSRPRDEP